MVEPIEIVQSYLDRLGDAVMEGDFKTYRDGVYLPFTMVTAQGTARIETESDLRKGYDGFRDMIKSKGATKMQRVALRADLFENGMVSGSYSTKILKGDCNVVEPFQSAVALLDYNGNWRATWISTYLKDAHQKINLPPEWAGTRKRPLKSGAD